MKKLLSILTLSALSFYSAADDFDEYCYQYEHNLAENNTLRKLFIQFDVGDCLAVQSIISKTNHLDLSHADIIDVKPFKYMQGVVHLNLSNNSISDLAELARAYQLESLDLSNNRIFDFSPLANLTQLKTLKISGNPLDKNEYNCPTDSSNQALNAACFDIQKFESNFYISDNQEITQPQLESALNQIFKNRASNFDQIVNLNAFSISGTDNLFVRVNGKQFNINGTNTSSYALTINLMVSNNSLKIEFDSPSGQGTARFEKNGNSYTLKHVEE